MEKNDIANLRRDYSQHELSEKQVDADPFAQFSQWLDEAMNSEALEPTAMTLSTVAENGTPSSRVVLLKGVSDSGLVFFTNYESRKGRELTANPIAVVNFFWPELERQINVSGNVERVSQEESETYFKSRPVKSRIAAWASHQSSTLASREELEKRVEELNEKFGEDVPLPPFWGGFRLKPIRFEFWQGRRSRLHDRICYELKDNAWQISRLSP